MVYSNEFQLNKKKKKFKPQMSINLIQFDYCKYHQIKII